MKENENGKLSAGNLIISKIRQWIKDHEVEIEAHYNHNHIDLMVDSEALGDFLTSLEDRREELTKNEVNEVKV